MFLAVTPTLRRLGLFVVLLVYVLLFGGPPTSAQITPPPIPPDELLEPLIVFVHGKSDGTSTNTREKVINNYWTEVLIRACTRNQAVIGSTRRPTTTTTEGTISSGERRQSGSESGSPQRVGIYVPRSSLLQKKNDHEQEVFDPWGCNPYRRHPCDGHAECLQPSIKREIRFNPFNFPDGDKPLQEFPRRLRPT